MKQLVTGGHLTGKTHRLVELYRDDVEVKSKTLWLSFYESNNREVRRMLSDMEIARPALVTTFQRFVLSILERYAGHAHLADQTSDLLPDEDPFEMLQAGNPDYEEDPLSFLEGRFDDPFAALSETKPSLPGDSDADKPTSYARKTNVISAASRGVVIRQAWQMVGGNLWTKYRNTPGATEELTRVINWISSNRRHFGIGDGELAAHDLARIYHAFITLCETHKFLTFQESTLRVLDLLEDPDIWQVYRDRFTTIVVDDIHHARPDQLAVIERLVTDGGSLLTSADLHAHHVDPRLRCLHQSLNEIDSVSLDDIPDGVNEGIAAVASRLVSALDCEAESRCSLMVANTVEEESRSVAAFIRELLEDDILLRPADIIVICADHRLKRFIQRTLTDAGIETAPPVPAPGLNPLIRSALLLSRWYAGVNASDTLAELLRLPAFALDPYDLSTTEAEMRRQQRQTFDVTDDDALELSDSKTLPSINRIRSILVDLETTRALTDRLLADMESLGFFEWEKAFGEEQLTWRATFDRWISAVRELESTVDILDLSEKDIHAYVERITDYLPTAHLDVGVRVLDPESLEGVRSQVACVVGLSENAIPRSETEMQMIAESELAGLFLDGRQVTVPAYGDHAAWAEREMRRLATMLTRGIETLYVSTSRYGPDGDAQLPSPFFELLLGTEGEIDRNGDIDLTSRGLWTSIDMHAPQSIIAENIESSRTDEPVITKVITPKTFSASQIRTYLQCPLQFYYDTVLGADSDESPGARRRGALIHEVLCATMGDGRTESVNLTDRERSTWLSDTEQLTERAIGMLHAAWSGETFQCDDTNYSPAEPWHQLFGPTLQRRAVKRWAEGVLRRWALLETEGRGDEIRRPVLLESSFTFKIGVYTITGRIDRVDEVELAGKNGLDIIDYKSGSAGAVSLAAQLKKFLPENDDGPTDYQLPIYALALQSGVDTLKQLPRLLSYINLDKMELSSRGKFKAEAMRSVVLGEPPGDVKKGILPASILNEKITDDLIAVLDAISSSPYPATPGYYCAGCGYRNACSRGRTYGSD